MLSKRKFKRLFKRLQKRTNLTPHRFLLLLLSCSLIFLLTLSFLTFAFFFTSFSHTTAHIITHPHKNAINFAPIEPPLTIQGEIQIFIDNKTPNPTILCLDNNAATALFPCHHEDKNKESTQMFAHRQGETLEALISSDRKKCITTLITSETGMEIVRLTEMSIMCHRFTRDRYGRLIIVNTNSDDDNDQANKCLVVVSHPHTHPHAHAHALKYKHTLGIIPCDDTTQPSHVIISTRFTFLTPKGEKTSAANLKMKSKYDFNQGKSFILIRDAGKIWMFSLSYLFLFITFSSMLFTMCCIHLLRLLLCVLVL